jgi:putative SOS response-associated peptidase YedK
MCNVYSVTHGQEAMRRLLRVTRDSTGNLPGLPAVFPDMMAPVVRAARDGERELSLMRWGFPPPPIGNAPVTNVRNLKSPYWRGWLKAEWRCLVPAASFCEWTDSRPKVTRIGSRSTRAVRSLPSPGFGDYGRASGKAKPASISCSRS